MTKVLRTGRTWLAGLLVGLAACGGGGDSSEAQPVDDNPLLRPAALAEEAPESFRARFETSKGDFVIEVTRAWAPNGADRFYTLVKNGYFDGIRFYRVIEGFMAQFGIHGDPRINAAWRGLRIMDDSVAETNARGTVSFATSGANSRTTQIFINFRDNGNLDEMGFSPFGTVVEGMDVVDQIYSGYGEGAPRGSGPAQNQIHAGGNAFLEAEFPELDYVVSASVEP